MVQPQVYGDSLSYYEVLNKLTSAIIELEDFVENKWDATTNITVQEYLNNLFAKTIYNADTKNISFIFDETVVGDTHRYDPNTGTLTVE